ncbi:MAG: hypothetical protein IT422_01770 [Pirellulaceae bacterium]|nr:hypothetical protein [Pirellulaceae bacterium]
MQQGSNDAHKQSNVPAYFPQSDSTTGCQRCALVGSAAVTLLAIMGRMATYTGQQITWDMAWNSQEDLSPPRYEWGELATPTVAVPGVAKFV